MRRHWLLLPPISAVILVSLGGLSLFWPIETFCVLPKILGVGFLFAGLLQLFFYFFHHKAGFLPGFGWLAGIVTFATGAIFLLNSHVSLLFAGICFGIWSIVWGCVRCGFAFKKRSRRLPWKLPLATSCLYVICGIALLFSPYTGQQTAARILGGILMIAGCGILYSWISTKHIFQKHPCDSHKGGCHSRDSSNCTTNNK